MKLETSDKLNELHSEEVQRIIGRSPRWILSWGITLLLLVVGLLLIGSYFYKYPDIVNSEIIVTNENAPKNIIVKTSGKIIALFAQENEHINEGKLLAVIDNDARFEDVFKIKEILKGISFDNPSMISFYKRLTQTSVILGEIDSVFYLFKSKFNDLIINTNQTYWRSERSDLVNQINLYEKLNVQLDIQIALHLAELTIINEDFLRDSILYCQNSLSENEYKISKNKTIQKKIILEDVNITLTKVKINSLQLKQQIKEYDSNKFSKIQDLKNYWKKLVYKLNVMIAKWQEKYVIVSPIEGKVHFAGIWDTNQNINEGELIFTVNPSTQGKIFGTVKIPTAGSGKIKGGQIVNIKFLHYPYMEYGIVQGRIKDGTMIQSGKNYFAEVEFPNGLISNYGKSLKLLPGMTGSAEIVTDDMRLIERIINPIRSLLDKNQN